MNDIIRLNVGGRLLATSRATLTKVQGSLLERMFNPESLIPPATTFDGAYFIDEDPDVFTAVLNWLRHGVVQTSIVSLEQLLVASSYFGLDCLAQELLSRQKEEKIEQNSDDDWKEKILVSFSELKWLLSSITSNLKDLPSFLLPNLLQFQVEMALKYLDGGTLDEICYQICMQQLSDNSHVTPSDIKRPVLMTLQKMKNVSKDRLQRWHLEVSNFTEVPLDMVSRIDAL